MLIVTLTL